MDYQMPTNLYELVTEAINDKENSNETYANTLIKVLKKYHLWPAMQVKKFKDSESLVLLHNTYKRDDTVSFQKLYDQCRSVVLDFSLSCGNNIVVSYSYSIPERITSEEYSPIINPDTDKYQEAYDGTMIAVYNYNNTWHFGTSCCTDVNSSKFPHPTKSHGYMLNEVLMAQFRSQFSDEELISSDEKTISDKLRQLFTSQLDPMIAYEFVLLHHENVHIVDYSATLGQGYKVLYHINSKNRISLEEIDLSSKPLSQLGIQYPVVFSNAHDAYTHVNTTNSYGFIVKKYDIADCVKLFKISPSHIVVKEENDPCNPNVWHNILIVYMKNRQDYKIADYISTYAPWLQLPIDNHGRLMDPTYLIHTMISTLKDVLYNLYNLTTSYNARFNKFRVNRELDQSLPPVIRFHLAQLRYRQINYHKNDVLKAKHVYYYLCHCNNVKNIKLLNAFIATSAGYDIPERAALCSTILNSLL